MKKIYIAGKFEKKDYIISLYERAKAMGYEIAYDWTKHKFIKPYSDNADLAREYSAHELAGINEADVFIYISDDAGHTLHMEFGAALMSATLNGKLKIFAVGAFNDKSPWFFNSHVTRCETAEEALELIG
jgi:hypothetical protein